MFSRSFQTRCRWLWRVCCNNLIKKNREILLELLFQSAYDRGEEEINIFSVLLLPNDITIKLQFIDLSSAKNNVKLTWEKANK